MVFSSDFFLLMFLPIALMGYYLLHLVFPCNLTPANRWLLLVSIVFYAWGEPVYVVLMILSIIINWLLGVKLSDCTEHRNGKMLLAAACVFNLGMLFVFKYLGWILGMVGYQGSLAKITLPIGISFYTFQSLSYVIDIYRKKNSAQRNLLDVGLYISFFPQLIAGPIIKYGSVAPQIHERNHTFEKFSEGVQRFCIGLCKKVLLANQLAVFSEYCFEHAGDGLTVLMAWAGVVSAALQIYFDFSGYSDMAIGLGKMFGFTFAENFNYPFVSTSVTEFWRRWHISLGEWFREYLFYPFSIGPGVKIQKKVIPKFGHSAAKFLSAAATLFVVWMCTGLWHGANWTFLIWGFLQFAAMLWELKRSPFKQPRVEKILGWIRANLFWLVGMALCSASSVSVALVYYKDMLGLSGNALANAATFYWLGQYGLILLAGILFAFPVIPKLGRLCRGNRITGVCWECLTAAVLLFLYIVCVCYTISGGYNPFIYFNF